MPMISIEQWPPPRQQVVDRPLVQVKCRTHGTLWASVAGGSIFNQAPVELFHRHERDCGRLVVFSAVLLDERNQKWQAQFDLADDRDDGQVFAR